MYCRICSTKFNENERFCRNCGTEREEWGVKKVDKSEFDHREVKEEETVKEVPIKLEIVEIVEEKIPSLTSNIYVYALVIVTMIVVYFLMFSTNLMV